jgi:hypothetical protein
VAEHDGGLGPCGLCGPDAIASDGTHVWAANEVSVTELDAATGALVQVISGKTLHETRGLSLPELITRWQDSADFGRSSLRSFLTQAYGGPFARPADLQAELARTLTLIARRLGSGWTPGLPEPVQPTGTE